MSTTPSFLNEIRQFHNEYSLAGSLDRSLLNLSDQVLSYLVSILNQEEPFSLPQISNEEWFDLLSYLSHHGIVPLLYFKVAQFPTELRPPEKIAARMRKVFLISHARYVRMLRQIKEILDAFSEKRIDVLVIKGPALALTTYPEPSTRPFADIDLLVKLDQYLKARHVLTQLGYCSQIRRFDMFNELFNAEPFCHPKDGTKPFEIDIHWSLYQYHGIKRDNDVREFFNRAKTVETPGLTFQTLDPVDALIYAAFHLILHHPDALRLTWISDIAFLASNLSETDQWENLQKRASALKLCLATQKALELAQMWNGIEIPELYQDFTKWPKVTTAEKDEFTYVTNKHGPDIRLKGYLASLRTNPEKIKYLLKIAFPDSDLIRMTYPPSKEWLLPWSYVRRWWHWYRKLVRYAFHRWQKIDDR
jgi:hypothetical protein